MHRNPIYLTLLLAPLLIGMTPEPPSSGQSAYCDFYAAGAVNQVSTAFASAVCQRNIEGPRWTRDYKYHYAWCLAQPAAAVEAEYAARSKYLWSCRGL